MRIVKPHPDPSVEKEAICRNGCGATIAYVPNDVQSYIHHDYGGGIDTVRYIQCPQCNKDIIVR